MVSSEQSALDAPRFLLLVFVAVAIIFAPTTLFAQETPRSQPQSPRLTVLVVDATSSLELAMPRGGTRRSAFLDAARAVIRQAEKSRTPMVIARVCGVTETLFGPAVVTKKDFGALATLVKVGLSSCSVQSPIVSSERLRGTDLVEAVQWVASKPQGARTILLTDGFHQPPQLNGRLSQREFYTALDQLAPSVRERLWIFGLDEVVRDEVAARIPHSWGLYDLFLGLRLLIGEIKSESGR